MAKLGLLRRLLCWMGQHKRLDVIQTFGAAEHVGCPHCGRQYAIHHGIRAFVPWDADFASMYRRFGHDVDGATARWKAYRRALDQAGKATTYD